MEQEWQDLHYQDNMAHVRKSIREHVVTTVTSLSTTGSNVYETRYFPLQTGNLPALIVYTLDETIEDLSLIHISEPTRPY